MFGVLALAEIWKVKGLSGNSNPIKTLGNVNGPEKTQGEIEKSKENVCDSPQNDENVQEIIRETRKEFFSTKDDIEIIQDDTEGDEKIVTVETVKVEFENGRNAMAEVQHSREDQCSAIADVETSKEVSGIKNKVSG